MIGSTVDKDGKDIQAQTGFIPVLGGVVKGKVTHLGHYSDKDGNVNEERGYIIIKQENGAELRQIVFTPREDDANDLDQFNKFWLHIASQVLTGDQAKQLGVDCKGSFSKLWALMQERVLPKYQEVDVFHRVVFTQNKKDGKFYPKLSKPNFIEVATTDRATTLAYSEGSKESFTPTAKVSVAPPQTQTEEVTFE